MGLSGVLDNPEAAPAGEIENRINVGRLTEEVDGDNCSSPRANGIAQPRSVEILCAWIAVDGNGRRS